MSNNLFVKLRRLLPPSPVLIGTVLEINTVDDTSTVELPTNQGINDYALGVGTGSRIRARGTFVPVGEKAFVRDGVIESRAPSDTPVEIEIGVVTPPPPPAGLFVAVGPTVKTSSDGVTWASHTPPITVGWRGVAYGGGLFVAVNVVRQPDMVMTSPDGAAWTMRNGDTTQTGWKSIAYGNGVFVATRAVAGTQSVMSSPDGVNWTLRTHASFGPISTVAFGGGVFVAVAWSGTNTQRVMTSVDGETWTIRTTPNLARTWTCAAYAQGKFVIGSASSVNPAYVLTSSDGTSWSSGIRPEPYDAWESLIESPSGGFVGVTLDGGYLIRSSDGITWTSDYGITVPGLGYLASDGTRLVWAGYASPFITTSDDGGLTWTMRDTGSSFGYVTFGSP